jgi:hypothetical protein
MWFGPVALKVDGRTRAIRPHGSPLDTTSVPALEIAYNIVLALAARMTCVSQMPEAETMKSVAKPRTMPASTSHITSTVWPYLRLTANSSCTT